MRLKPILLSMALGCASVGVATPAMAADGEITPLVQTMCDPNSSWYSVSSSTKGGKVTSYSKHVKNDSTKESFTWSTTTSVSFKASMTSSGSFSIGAGIEKLAEASLGITAGYGLEGQIATTTSYSRNVEFTAPGKWVIWRGVYTGTGSVAQYRCNGNGTAQSTVGSGSGQTFKNATVTGLTNCANSVSDLVEKNAKALCG